MIKKYDINPKMENIAIMNLIADIDKGYELQEIESELTDEEKLKYTGAIIIAPDYQREYRFKLEDEAKLVESVFLNIPIPPVFFAVDKYKGVKVRNIVDGQHRLRALYRFKNLKFQLQYLDLIPEINGKFFSDLEIDEKTAFIDAKISAIIFEDFPGIEFEMEIFSRYNKGTKPLSPQEIRHAAYNSKFNEFVNGFVKKVEKDRKPEVIVEAYNISKDRIQKKKVQEGIFVILSILESGVNIDHTKSLVYAEEYMKSKKELEITNPSEAEISYENMVKVFDKFNEFISVIAIDIEYPFSKEIYGISSRNYKFQISIAMILAGIFQRKLYGTDYLDKIISSNDERKKFLKQMEIVLQNSFLEDPEYNASSTNSKKIKELVESFPDMFG